MKHIALTFAALMALAAPALAFPTGIEFPTLTWPEPVVGQSCADPVALDPAICAMR
jgi:hypothetical protein